jgi:hypothetical protein
MLGGKAYDRPELREELNVARNQAGIPNHYNRKQPFSYSKRLYRLR